VLRTATRPAGRRPVRCQAMKTHVTLAAGLAALAVSGLSACSGSNEPAGTSGATAAMTECTKTALTQPATEAARALGPDNLYTVDELTCADGWAVTSGLLSSEDNPSMGAPTSFVFEQVGQFWVLKDKRMVCGTDPVTTTPPADAEIPAALFLAGCAAG
jgi:hypothetical protein